MVRGILPLSDSDWGESISPFSSYDICVSQVLESKLQSLLYSTSRTVTLDIGKDTETPPSDQCLMLAMGLDRCPDPTDMLSG